MLATNIIEELIAQGYSVRGILRNKSRYKGIINHNLELIEGDFCNLGTIEQAITDCNYVIHTAAITAQNIHSYKTYKRVNVDATEQLLQVAIAAKVSRFLYVSTANTIGFGTPQSPSDESKPMVEQFTKSMYARSKKEAEDIVLSYKDSIDVIVANPTLMIGRYGSASGSNRILKMIRRIVIIPNGGKNFIDVIEASRACVAALQRGRNGEKYLICGENMSYKEFFNLFTRVQNIITLPNIIIHIIGILGDSLRFFGINVDFSLTNMKMLSTRVCYSNKKLRTELGYNAKQLIDSDIAKYS